MSTCAHCGGPTAYRRKYCGPECRSAASAKRTVTCETCGTAFLDRTGRARFCSVACCDEAKRRPRSSCDNCGEPFRPKARDRTSFCSRACAYRHQAWRAKRRRLVRRRNDHVRRLTPCAECGRQFVKRRRAAYCSDGCRKEVARVRARERAEARHAPADRRCRECGRSFLPAYGSRRRDFCCGRCGARYARRVGKAARRARKRGNGYEYFDPVEVLRRDRWRCQLCGAHTPERLRGTHDDRAPELDHIVPLAMGGAHTRANTQCLCRSCNQIKGAAAVGQLALDLAA